MHIVISGFVQGVGFRPFVYRLANELQIKGCVSNNTGQVTIVAEGNREVLDLFCETLLIQAPINAKPLIQSINEITLHNYEDFSIKESNKITKSDIHILPDLPVCDQCLEELFDENNRRYLYPFINCTQCGPRNSIITSLPYDRNNTSMQSFKLCSACDAEYQNPGDSRFHAEPIACDACGPVLNFVDSSQNITSNVLALEACIEALNKGLIIAVKGIGGYHLMCDATSSEAVTLLRNRKIRPDKPFAILMARDQIDVYVNATKEEISLLQENCRPIVLIKHNRGDDLANNLAVNINRLGVMLPSTPLQYLICHYFKKPLVATSANISGEPIITLNDDAVKKLLPLCDAYLHNNRDIVRPADDPVILHNNISSQVLRTGRGLTPTEITLPFNLEKPVLAVGGHIKNTIALAWDNHMVISAHNGDLSSLRGYQTFQQAIKDLQQLYQVSAEVIICDAHPEYASTQWANDSHLPIVKTYHHYVHASSLALEEPENTSWLIFSWDGIGLGADGTLWGGETFLGTPGNWQRVVSFKTFKLPGGEKTSRESWRVAASLNWQSDIDFELNNETINKTQSDALKMIWEKNINSPESSAAGRLFSAAASLLGLVDIESFEGHGPMLLQALAETTQADAILLPVNTEEDIDRIDWQPLIEMLNDKSLSKEYRARCFHETMAQCITEVSIKYANEYKCLSIGLSGGVFQNQLLVSLISQRFDEHNLKLIMPESIPVNDGGLCAGQIIEYYYQ
ncbi:MAG: carbamoyltransferase HypF [Woeseiaceae bacterium]